MDHADAESVSGMAMSLPKISVAVKAHVSCSDEAIAFEELNPFSG